MKKCFMKKLLSSFLALTMVVTTVPANVVSATTEKQLTQEAKKQNKNKNKGGNLFSKEKAKKIAATVAENSSTVLNGVAAGASAVLAGATYLNVYKQIKELKKTVGNKDEEQVSEKTENMINDFNDSFSKFLRKSEEEMKNALSKFAANAANATNSTNATKLNSGLSDEHWEEMEEMEEKLREMQKNIEFSSIKNLFASCISSLGLLFGPLVIKLGWFVCVNAIINGKEIWGAVTSLGGKAGNLFSTLVNDIGFNTNSTQTINGTESIFSPTPTPFSLSK